MNTHAHIPIHVQTHTYTCRHAHTIHTLTYTHAHSHMHTYAHAHSHIHTHTYTHAHIHTYVLGFSPYHKYHSPDPGCRRSAGLWWRRFVVQEPVLQIPDCNSGSVSPPRFPAADSHVHFREVAMARSAFSSYVNHWPCEHQSPLRRPSVWTT